MVICCSALGCKKRQNSLDGNKVSFHRFPRDKDLCEAWLVASRRLDFVPSKYSYLCSDHFTEDQFNRTQKGFRLRPNAVPTVFQLIPKTKKKAPRKISTKKGVSEVQPTFKIAPKKKFKVQPTVKIAPKQKFEVQPTVKIAPKPAIDAPVKIVPTPPVVNDVVSLASNPIITNLSSIADTVISSNLIEAALSAYKQSTNSTMSLQQPNGTPVSIYVVHPQPNGSNIVTIPSIGNFPSANVGTLPTPNGGSLPSSASQCATNAESSPKADLLTTQDNIQKIKRYEERIKKYRRDIKVLQSQHRRQNSKIEKLQSIIKDLRSSDFMEEEEEEGDVSEDMSEDEIYAELLKRQSESDKEDSDDDCQI